MNKTDYFWTGVAVAILGMEWRTRKGPGSLSRFTRKVFKIHTTPGKLAFLGSWGPFAGWVVYHIIFDQQKEYAS